MKVLLKALGGIVVFTLAFSCIAQAADRPLRTTWAWPTYIDPAVGSDNSSTNALGNMYDTLVVPDKTGAPQPHLATSWNVSKDGKAWTFKLRRDVKFHNGDPLTSSDVKFSMDRMLTIGEGFAHLFSGKVDAVEAPDTSTVIFKLKDPFGPFLSTLFRLYVVNQKQVMANVITPGPYGDKGDFGKKWLVSHTAASGPYKLKEFKVEERLVMSLNTDYWQTLDPLVPDEYTMLGTTEAITVRTLMSRGELEVADRWQSNESLNALSRIKGVGLAKINGPGQFYAMIHTKKPPTDDIHFRKAMAYAMDYDTVTTHLFPGTTQAKGPIPRMMPGFDDSVFQYRRDLDKARAELEKSRYYSALDKNPVVIHWIAEVPDEEKVALLFMSNMAEIGINVDVVKVPWMSVVEETAAMDTSPHIVTIFDEAHYPEAAALLQSRYASPSANTWEQNEWLLDSTYDTMLEEALKTMDRESRFKQYAELQHYIVEQCPTLFMFDVMSRHAYRSDIMDWPAARGEVPPVQGYELLGRYIKIRK
ncbi:MAG: ABC transporter substrate-binding protein [Desulfobacteraceae bacterium]|nr:ABC transporter substrate-binding protein [Desulfobacteraceae bacterium]